MHRIVVIAIAALLAGGTIYLWHSTGPRAAEASLTRRPGPSLPEAVYLPNHTRHRAIPQLSTSGSPSVETGDRTAGNSASTTPSSSSTNTPATTSGELAPHTRRAGNRIHLSPDRIDRARLEARLAHDKRLTDAQRRQIKRMLGKMKKHEDPIPGASTLRAHLLGPCAGADVQKRYDALAAADKPAMRAKCARFGIELH